MIAVLSNADAGVIVTIITGVFGFIAHRNRQDIKQINKAVNHQAPDAPTLVQRVIRLEDNQEIHTAWSAKAFETIARQLGVKLPERPASIVDYDDLPRKDDA